MTRRTATGVGFLAVLLWALLALFTVGSAPVPPFQLAAICFATGGAIGVIWGIVTGTLGSLRNVPASVYVLGTLGLFGYHALYFFALRLAPPAGAGLIAYLWPLLIVLFSGLLPGERLRSGHVIGGLLGFLGAVVIIAGRLDGIETGFLPGYSLAMLCAVTWASYSVYSRRVGDVPSVSVTVFCLASAVLALPLHFAFETTVWPDTTLGWVSIAGLATGPVGIAFFVWDVGVKRGDIQLLGVLSYAAPVLSTLALVGAGLAQPSTQLWIATALITGGALLAGRASAAKKA